MFVPVNLCDHVVSVAGLHYFWVNLFEQNTAGGISRFVINVGCKAEFVSFVLLLPILRLKNYADLNDVFWTMAGTEYERLSADASLHSVYNLPINLQNMNVYHVPVNGADDVRAVDNMGQANDFQIPIQEDDDTSVGYV